MENAKPWYLSKTIITSGVAFAVALITSIGIIDADTGTKIQGLLIPLMLTFLRVGNAELA